MTSSTNEMSHIRVRHALDAATKASCLACRKPSLAAVTKLSCSRFSALSGTPAKRRIIGQPAERSASTMNELIADDRDSLFTDRTLIGELVGNSATEPTLMHCLLNVHHKHASRSIHEKVVTVADGRLRNAEQRSPAISHAPLTRSGNRMALHSPKNIQTRPRCHFRALANQSRLPPLQSRAKARTIEAPQASYCRSCHNERA
jgi:hypothetical protein